MNTQIRPIAVTEKNIEKPDKVLNTVKIIIPHLIFWMVRTGLMYQSLIIRDDAEDFLIYTKWLLPIDIIAVYFTAYFLVPKLLLKKKYVDFIISIIISATIFVVVGRLTRYYIIYPETWEKGLEKPIFYFPYIFSSTISLYSYVFLFSGIKVFQVWREDERRRQSLERQNLNGELALLRSQINPHFLFNTLNNIDSLVYIDQDKASDAILQLSEIMRYMIYEANTDIVPLEREIEYLTSMVDLIRLRLKDNDYIEFKVDGDARGKEIPPMLLVPFIENAYKHGKKSGISPGIIFNLKISKNYYTFEAFNYYDNQNTFKKDAVGGIGLSNVQRRLKLLYGKDHTFEIERKKGEFKVFLKIPSKVNLEQVQEEQALLN